jgi:hypothetical protein
MRFRTVVIAAVLLVLASVAGLAAYQISDTARGEAAQMTVERTDSLAVEPGYRQKLVSDADHDPTRYGSTVTVVYNGTEWTADGNYTYYQESGEIEFQRDENGSANITYQYDIPRNQVADDQLQTLTESYGQVIMVVVGLAFVVLLLFIGGFVARKMGVGNQKLRSNR